MKSIYLLGLIFTFNNIFAQSQNEQDSQYVRKHFLIILSSKNYQSAKTIAIEAARKLNLKLDLRGLKPNLKSGLSYSSKECEGNGWDYPCYVSRGRYDDGEFVTIDYSNAFDGFAKGFYIVTTASGDPSLVKKALIKVKNIYRSAYIKKTDVFMGCMH